MADSAAIKMKKGVESICGKCLHVQVCRFIPPFPCVECYQFFPAVVRCKDCVSGHEQLYGNLFRCNVMGCGGLKPDDFCSYGERKDGDGK